MTTVIRIRSHARPPTIAAARYVYVGRPSKWGNPYVIGQPYPSYPEAGRPMTRTDVLALYEQWLDTQPDLLAALPELRDKVLGCWCHPDPCHADILARRVNALYADAA